MKQSKFLFVGVIALLTTIPISRAASEPKPGAKKPPDSARKEKPAHPEPPKVHTVVDLKPVEKPKK